MTTFLARLLRPPLTTSGDAKVSQALALGQELVQQMRERSDSNDPARALLADIWAQRHNVPFMTTVFEAAEEMKVIPVQVKHVER